MNPKEILKAIDPKGHEIEKLQAELAILEHKNEKLRAEVKANARHDLEREWMRQHGVMLETTEGMKYLKDDDYDAFFKRLKIMGDAFRVGTLDNDVNPLKNMGNLEYELMTEKEQKRYDTD
jgi:hypothetical protein